MESTLFFLSQLSTRDEEQSLMADHSDEEEGEEEGEGSQSKEGGGSGEEGGAKGENSDEELINL